MSGSAGTTFTVSGDRCVFDAGSPPGPLGAWSVSPVGGGDPLVGGSAPAGQTGVWQDTFPSDPLAGPASYLVQADCVDSAGAVLYRYEPVTITVTAPGAPASAPARAAATGPAFTG